MPLHVCRPVARTPVRLSGLIKGLQRSSHTMGPRKEYLAIDSILDLDFCEGLVLGKNERKYSGYSPNGGEKW